MSYRAVERHAPETTPLAFDMSGFQGVLRCDDPPVKARLGRASFASKRADNPHRACRLDDSGVFGSGFYDHHVTCLNGSFQFSILHNTD